MPVRYSEEVEKAIAEVCPPRDAFDAADFDPVEYLNSRFPNEASLTALPIFLEETNNRLRQTENELLKAVEAQATNSASADSDLRHAKDAVSELYERVSDIKTKAARSEETVKELCQHIRELDIAKTNLTSSINTLRSIQLWMLQLQALSTSFERRRYIQCRDALQEAQKYAAMFADMKDIPKVKELNDKQTQLCRQVEYHIRNTVFGDLSAENMDEGVMAEACAIVDLMEPDSIKKIRDRFIDKALESYALRFKRGTDDAKLERTERRYVYIRSLLEHYNSLFQNVFPRHWCVPQELCLTFCLRTKQELDFQLREAAGSIDVVVLTYVLQKTIDIERDLTQLMAWKDEFPGRRELPVYKYNGLILSAFKEHMGLFVQNEDKLMSDALAQPLIGEGESTCAGWNGEEDVRVGTTLPLAEDLFVFIKGSLKRSLRLSQQDVLLDMAGVWRSHLIHFSQSIVAVLPTPAVNALEVRRACIVLNTADFCQTTSKDLAEEVCARSEAPAKEVGFDQVTEAFSGLYSKSVVAIVQGLECTMAPLVYEYGNGGFMTRRDDDGGAQDETRLVRAMATMLHETVLNCTAVLPPPTLRFLLDKIAASIIPKYTNTLYRLRRMPIEAVSAMRVDSAALEKTFLQLPNYNDPDRFAPQMLTGYMKLVRREFDQLHRALKVLQVDASGETFVDVYYDVTLPEDRSIQNFVRLVELKGLRREEVRPWIASLSKRGVVEATRRDMMREASLGLATGSAPGGGGGVLSASSSASGGMTGLNFGALFSRDPIAVASGSPPPPGSPTTGTGFFSTFVNTLGSNSSPTTGHNTGAFGGGAGQSSGSSLSAAAAGAGGSGGSGGLGAGGQTPEESFGSRFANAARSTATSISFLNKFKKADGK